MEIVDIFGKFSLFFLHLGLLLDISVEGFGWNQADGTGFWVIMFRHMQVINYYWCVNIKPSYKKLTDAGIIFNPQWNISCNLVIPNRKPKEHVTNTSTSTLSMCVFIADMSIGRGRRWLRHHLLLLLAILRGKVQLKLRRLGLGLTILSCLLRYCWDKVG